MGGIGDEPSSRRKARRFPVQLPVFFSWKAENGSLWQGRGTTRDISAEGVFVTTEFYPPVNVLVSLRMLLPTTASGQQLRINADAIVVRAERCESGFAVRSQKRLWVSKSQAEPVEAGEG